MGLEKQVVVDKIEVLENGTIQVREATKIIEDGKVMAKKFNRHVLHPGNSLGSEDPKVIAVANALWTDEVIQSWEDSKSQVIGK